MSVSAMSADNKVTTRNPAKSGKPETPEPASLQSIDDKLNSIINILRKHTDDIQDIKKEQKDLAASIELCHTNISDVKQLVTKQDSKITACEDELTQPRPIIVKFVSRLDKDDFWNKRKVRRNLRATDLGYSSEKSIYINESLTPANRELLKMTREAAKQKGYNQVWTTNCSIFVRREKGSPVIKITSSTDLQRM
ncbi:uncharacterized protein LOC124369553 [Homalodisca vitripennis]|uniref:uncharacterized protein LOC124369553 n=1 Tax=Homalodisca vitripennis TaxID=197043 RepID=UPI001EEB4ECE|nr:uncharacterized protein LOC124369553 [Homalodisca vitripennis]